MWVAMSAAHGHIQIYLKCATDARRSGEKHSWHTIWKLRVEGNQNHFLDRLIRYCQLCCHWYARMCPTQSMQNDPLDQT